MPVSNKERDELLAALKDIAEPLVGLQRDADHAGARLNGAIALALCNDAEWLRGKARAAIAKAEGQSA